MCLCWIGNPHFRVMWETKGQKYFIFGGLALFVGWLFVAWIVDRADDNRVAERAALAQVAATTTTEVKCGAFGCSDDPPRTQPTIRTVTARAADSTSDKAQRFREVTGMTGTDAEMLSLANSVCSAARASEGSSDLFYFQLEEVQKTTGFSASTVGSVAGAGIRWRCPQHLGLL